MGVGRVCDGLALGRKGMVVRCVGEVGEVKKKMVSR